MYIRFSSIRAFVRMAYVSKCTKIKSDNFVWIIFESDKSGFWLNMTFINEQFRDSCHAKLINIICFILEIRVLSVSRQCNVNVDGRFRGTCYFYLQGTEVSQSIKQWKQALS
jgi:hypothetical protein